MSQERLDQKQISEIMGSEIVGRVTVAPMQAAPLPEEWLKILRHTLGAGSKTPGYRNRYCAVRGERSWECLRDMAYWGLVTSKGCPPEEDTEWFRATEAGCKAIGFDDAAIKRAMGS